MDCFIKTHKISNLTHEETDNLNITLHIKEIKLFVKTFTQRELQVQTELLVNPSKHLWDKVITI